MEYHYVLMGEGRFSLMDKNSALHSHLLMQPIDNAKILLTF